MRNVLVTGGAGFIGSELVRQLAAGGARVTVLDNLKTGRRENLAELPETVRLTVGDVRDAALVAKLSEGKDVVFHLACLGVRHSIHSPQENHEVNATGTLTLLRAAREAGVRRFVHVSTSEVYGKAQWAPMTEEHPTFPETVYGASKLAGECYARAFYRTHGFPSVVVRPFNAYGPRCHHEGDSGEVIPRFLLRCLSGQPPIVFGDGEQTRDFTFVADTAAAILAAGSASGIEGETINVGSGSEVTINELARRVAALTGRSLEPVHAAPRPGDVLRLCADSRRAKLLLGYAPRTALDEGLGRLLQWYRSHPSGLEKLLAEAPERNWERDAARA